MCAEKIDFCNGRLYRGQTFAVGLMSVDYMSVGYMSVGYMSVGYMSVGYMSVGLGLMKQHRMKYWVQ